MAGQTAHLVELIDIVLQLTEALGLPAIIVAIGTIR